MDKNKRKTKLNDADNFSHEEHLAASKRVFKVNSEAIKSALKKLEKESIFCRDLNQ